MIKSFNNLQHIYKVQSTETYMRKLDVFGIPIKT